MKLSPHWKFTIVWSVYALALFSVAISPVDWISALFVIVIVNAVAVSVILWFVFHPYEKPNHNSNIVLLDSGVPVTKPSAVKRPAA